MKPEPQYIRPEGFDSSRFGFTNQMSAQTEHELSKCLAETQTEQREAVQHA